MTVFFPMIVCFSITDVGTTDEITSENTTVSASRHLSLTLTPRRDIEINLSNGQPLASTPVHLALFAGKTRATDLAPELQEGTVGFLIQTTEKNGKPFIHGSIAWPEDTLPYYLLNPSSSRSVWLSLASVETSGTGASYYAWQPGRENIISIASFRLGTHVSNEKNG